MAKQFYEFQLFCSRWLFITLFLFLELFSVKGCLSFHLFLFSSYQLRTGCIFRRQVLLLHARHLLHSRLWGQKTHVPVQGPGGALHTGKSGHESIAEARWKSQIWLCYRSSIMSGHVHHLQRHPGLPRVPGHLSVVECQTSSDLIEWDDVAIFHTPKLHRPRARLKYMFCLSVIIVNTKLSLSKLRGRERWDTIKKWIWLSLSNGISQVDIITPVHYLQFHQ